ncbi:hypothetical protein WJX72_000535 [[Myrmecia] bisecta]|uniref:Uncharacterized protein n=1 Tax=[Myrmecia] bisecta TaxID=41462 RepID=A0AAW1QNY2_9CHLO
MLLTQERWEAAPCGSRINTLAHACEPADPDLNGVPIHKNPVVKDPFGFDPVFGTYSQLWAKDLVGQEATYYNTSQGRHSRTVAYGRYIPGHQWGAARWRISNGNHPDC